MAEDKKTQIIDIIKDMSVMELSDLVKELEDVFDVTAQAAPVAIAGAVAGGEAVAEQTEFDVVLTDFGKKKIQVIKAVRKITGLGLKEAKALVDSAPSKLADAVEKDEAEKVKKQIEEAGATAEIK